MWSSVLNLSPRALCRLLVALGLLLGSPAWADAPWLAPAMARARRNPLPAAAASAGAALFASHCAACHGPAGRGDGLAAAALNPPPRDLTRAAVQRQTDGELQWKIEQGRGAMPAWSWLSLRERWSLVWAIRSLARSGPEAAPPAGEPSAAR